MQGDWSDLPAPLKDGKVLAGRDGRLFLADDYNQVLAQHTGHLRFTAEQLALWQRTLETRDSALAHAGAQHLFLIAPDAHAVYPDLLPGGHEPAPERPVHQLLARTRRSVVRVVYPLAELVRHREETVYPKTGSHWTGLGAFYAYRAMVEQLGAGGIGRTLSRDDVEVTEATVAGDLGAKLEPSPSSAYAFVEPREPRAHVVADNRVRNRGRRLTWEGGGSLLECLLFGDSFAMRLLPLLAEAFARLTFVHMPTLDLRLVAELRPDVVIGEMNERCLIVVPDDASAAPWHELEGRKVEAGDLLPPRGSSPAAPRAPIVSCRAPGPPA